MRMSTCRLEEQQSSQRAGRAKAVRKGKHWLCEQWKETSATETNSGEEEEERKSWRARLGLDTSRAFLGLHLESQSQRLWTPF